MGFVLIHGSDSTFSKTVLAGCHPSILPLYIIVFKDVTMGLIYLPHPFHIFKKRFHNGNIFFHI